MREDLEQQEQLAAIRGFWNDNKRWLVPLVALALLIAISVNLWGWWQNRQAVGATQALSAMESAVSQQDIDKARVAYKALVEDYASTTQAAIGGLQMARLLVGAGQLAEARTVLQQVSKKAADEYAWVARIRLAGVMLDENNAKDALEVLSGTPPRDYLPLVNDRRGDVQAALGNKEEARTAWKAAADDLSPQSPSRELVLRKLQTVDSFGVTK